jgi:hypothetical protein
MHKWHNLDIEAEEKIQQLQQQLTYERNTDNNYERNKDNYYRGTDKEQQKAFIRTPQEAA